MAVLVELEWVVTDEGELVRVPKSTIKPAKRVTKSRSPKTNPKVYDHGDPWCYFSDGCRCAPCTAAATAYSKTKRYERYATDPARIPHGTANGYKNYGCRCVPCRKAVRAYQRRYVESPEAKARRNERKRKKRAEARQTK